MIRLCAFSDEAAPSLAGQFALNLTMPITLWLLYRAMPDAPVAISTPPVTLAVPS